MQVDIYDFDHTLFPMDSGSRFFGYCMLHYPDTRFCTVPNNYGSFAGHQNNQLYHIQKIFFLLCDARSAKQSR